MAVALVGAFILLFGSLKVFLWVNERIIRRQVDPGGYEDTRVSGGQWREPNQKLDIFH